jgi:hypothetical protein
MGVCSVCGYWGFDGHAKWCADFIKEDY